MEEVIDVNKLMEYIKTNVPKPRSTDAQNLAQWKKDIANARRSILEGVRDHIISNIHGK